MPRAITVGIVGDRNSTNASHLGTDRAFRETSEHLDSPIDVEWLPTSAISASGRELDRFHGLLVAPGSPYESMAGALAAIRWARESDIPILGTCGGFQHMIVEYARDVMGVTDADHEEEHPRSSRLFVTRLACSLVGTTQSVRILPGTRALSVYGRVRSNEPFYCNFGLNPERRKEVEAAGLRTSGLDASGEVRIMELPGHRNFFGTLFVPQMASAPGSPHPLLVALAKAAAE